MSVIYLAASVRDDRRYRYVGLACFKQGGLMNQSSTYITFGLSRGELLRAGVVKVRNQHPCADIALAPLARAEFERWPSVGGYCQPEEFIVDTATYKHSPMFVGAHVIIWECSGTKMDNMIDAINEHSNFGGYCNVNVENIGHSENLRMQARRRLSDEEKDVLNAVPSKGAAGRCLYAAVATGLHYLKRW